MVCMIVPHWENLRQNDQKIRGCHFERSEKSSALKMLRMHKISPSGRDDIFIYAMEFWFRPGWG
uniref:Uncharacterized protein n=1 Tax=Candidatus Kentrum sp. UNK TaxID=2126344 RepID=A0A451A7I6_9GAMM|nr:MAG: hypothetical protein BECKUNK1418G_GA0071005_10218 [Candidatus Kentron sp. UNK]VFK70334.1 MAG: hypothetical protein BECKUNK1418H_GA0071006_10278 [Candidatus Kentron sp. UNK]